MMDVSHAVMETHCVKILVLESAYGFICNDIFFICTYAHRACAYVQIKTWIAEHQKVKKQAGMMA